MNVEDKAVGIVVAVYALLLLGIAAFWSFAGWMIYLLVEHFTK